MIHFGVAGNSDANYVEKGVYSYGSLNRNYAEALGYDFFISTGIKIDSSIKIGMIKSIGQSLLVGWQNNISYGIDKIDITSTSFSSGMYRTLLTDFSSIGKEKYPLTLKTTFEALASGDTIKTKYDSNRRNIWNSQTEDTVGATENRMTIHEQIKEIQIEVEIETTNTTSPVVTGIVLETEKGERERLA